MLVNLLLGLIFCMSIVLTDCHTIFNICDMLDTKIILKPETLRSQVENFIRQEIITGRFKAGQKLIERELCEMLNISRAPLREALRKLEAEKLIVNIPHRGPTVRTISFAEAKEIYALRSLLEGHAAHEFARLATDQEVSELQIAARTLREGGELNSQEKVIASKAHFYEILLGGAGNSLVREILDSLLIQVNLLRSISLMHPDRLLKSLDEIDELVACIARRDPVGAQLIAKNHILNAQSAALGFLESQQIHPQH